MSDPILGSYQFFSWVRTGAAGVIAQPDPGDASIPAVVTLNVGLELTDSNTGSTTMVPPVALNLLGPGDVRGFDPSVVARVVPPAGSVNFEANYLPAIEFTRPDFPWLMTPAGPNGQQLRPWVRLIVVAQQAGVTLAPNAAGVHVLTIAPPATPTILPSLAKSWAWGHVQVVAGGDGAVSIADLLSSAPQQVLSRLLAWQSEQLTAQTRYYACVVPAFAIGVKAALGQEIIQADLDNLAPAWPDPAWPNAAAQDHIDLPVYYYWEFGTAAAGDFRTLARLLQPQVLPASIGLRPFDASNAGFGLPTTAAPQIPGVLRSLTCLVPPWKDAAFRSTLMSVLDTTPSASPELVPPTYGKWMAAPQTLAASSQWFGELNLDPRYRAFAGAGARVVESHWESLLAEAWAQLGDATRANHLLHIAQLTRGALGTVVARRIWPMLPDRRLAITSPLHARVPLTESNGTTTRPRTLEDILTRTDVADGMNPPVRRASSPRGIILQRGGALPDLINSHHALALDDGRIVVIGGLRASDGLQQAWLYDPAKNTWVITGTMAVDARYSPAAVTTQDGRVLVVGNVSSTSRAQVFDPASGAFSDVAAPALAQSHSSAILLSDGRVLVVGQKGALYDPSSNTWTSVGFPITTSQYGLWLSPPLLQLANGKILVAQYGTSSPTDPTKVFPPVLFDPSSRAWTQTGAMKVARTSKTAATLLADGRVLVTGAAVSSAPDASCEIYDPVKNSWSAVASMSLARAGHAAVTLADGRVFVFGGLVSGGAASTQQSEIYDPVRDSWSSGPPTLARYSRGPTATVLRSGKILAVGSTEKYFELLSLQSSRLIATQPVPIGDSLSAVGKQRVLADIGTSNPSQSGVLKWPTDAALAGVALPGTLGGNIAPAAFQLAARAHFSSVAKLTAPTIPAAWDHDGYVGELTALGRALSVEVTTFKTVVGRMLGTKVGSRPTPAVPATPVSPPPPGPDPLEPVLDGPTYTQPMFAALRDQGTEFILPGVSDIQDNTVALLQSTPEAIESYLVGLNSALNRMLVWQGYPTDQRGTAFRQFWDVAGRVPPPVTDAERALLQDIDAITAWPPANALGANLRRPSGGTLVLLVRGQLLQRYPDTSIYAAQAMWTPAGKRALGTVEKYPLYRATLAPDLTFVAFDLTVAAAQGSRKPADASPGWYFVLQQHPTAPEFVHSVDLPLADAATTAQRALAAPSRIAFHADRMISSS